MLLYLLLIRYEKIVISSTIKDSEEILISFCHFIGLKSQTNGGGIFISSIYDLQIGESVFLGCSSVVYGGAVYKSSGKLVIGKCCFKSCSTSTGDNNWGNAIYTSAGEIGCNTSSILKCGESGSPHGDTPIVGIEEKADSNHINISFCYGVACGSHFYVKSNEITNHSFSLVAYCNAPCVFESGSNSRTVHQYFNVIGNHAPLGIIYYYYSATGVFQNCVFVGNTGSSTINGPITFTDCVSDVAYSGFNQSLNPWTLPLQQFFDDECSFAIQVTKSHRIAWRMVFLANSLLG